MEPIIAGTKDIKPTLIFNNAGFVATGVSVARVEFAGLSNVLCPWPSNFS